MDHSDIRKQDSKEDGIDGLRRMGENQYLFHYSIVTIVVEIHRLLNLRKKTSMLHVGGSLFVKDVQKGHVGKLVILRVFPLFSGW